MTKNLVFLTLLASATLTHAADYYGDGNCPSAVTSAQEAANKADWIMQGTVDMIFTRSHARDI